MKPPSRMGLRSVCRFLGIESSLFDCGRRTRPVRSLHRHFHDKRSSDMWQLAECQRIVRAIFELKTACDMRKYLQMDIQRCARTIAALFFAASLLPATSNAQWRTRWEYTGPKGQDHWTELDPDYAAC